MKHTEQNGASSHLALKEWIHLSCSPPLSEVFQGSMRIKIALEWAKQNLPWKVFGAPAFHLSFTSFKHKTDQPCHSFKPLRLLTNILTNICATVERHYIKYGHTLDRYRSSIFPIASHSPGTLFLNASIRLRKIARTKIKSWRSRFFVLFIQDLLPCPRSGLWPFQGWVASAFRTILFAASP